MTWIPTWVPKWVIAILPYLVVVAIIYAGVWKYNHDVETARAGGFDAGVAYQKGVTETDTLRTRQENEDEKQRIERETQASLDAASADRNLAIANLDRLRSQIDRIRSVAEQYTGTQSASVSTAEIINMLADLYEASERDYNEAAAEADKYYTAGLACQLQYNSLRRKVDETDSEKVDGRSAPY